ncbi:hypothetical protein M408DRAFT_330948 [Serendipita vermifera MAFF 305830]|uniref:Uncharacterized protein n=1 Tax=Serendipita vermifera MAFF 305830 TaxID=933852 RepID=A0A0C2WH69_SERVB|nr:hypothetical protein M408DRAFT_330948 [Serendipita vermifera MAFF 305830]
MSIWMLRGESPGFPLILVTIFIRQLSPDSLHHFCRTSQDHQPLSGYPATLSKVILTLSRSRLPPAASSPSPYTRKRGLKSVAYTLRGVLDHNFINIA